MVFTPFVIEKNTHRTVYVSIAPATDEDIQQTLMVGWQTEWNSEYLQDPKIDRFSMKSDSGELIALGAYQIIGKQAYVLILYLESAPHSNPTIVNKQERKYSGIGEAMIAFGIKYSIDNGGRGEVIFDAKTEQLAEHYRKDFHALEITNSLSGGPRRFMLADVEAWQVFSKYLV